MVSKIIPFIAVLSSAVPGSRHQLATLAFTAPPPSSSLPKRPPSRELYMTSSFFADATESKKAAAAAAADVVVSEEAKKVQVDAYGRAFSPGCVVAISYARGTKKSPIRAHSVPRSSYGSFDPSTGEFVPRDESNASRSTSCLVLPEGLRGTVERVYDANEWDRARPIVVRFGEGYDRGEGGTTGGFDVPRAFVMHFDADELEVLDC
ncbi:hypothetical protein ACHAW5_011242 [Stephanodiscus triporus]|uniref:Uncharacterized protein n=1 Tax=Stephanodiscus triporus TaxID=2934178 RepID=A0ABD3PNW7_9STRA